MRTTRAGVYAAGDVTGRDPFVYMAAYGGKLAGKNALGGDSLSYDSSAMPRVVFTDPQVAGVGLTEAQARADGRAVAVGKYQFVANGKAQALAEPEGLVKIVAAAETGEILGVHIIGAEATELIAELTLGKTLEATVEEIGHTIHAHPTMAEAVMEAALDAMGQAIHL